MKSILIVMAKAYKGALELPDIYVGVNEHKTRKVQEAP